MMQGVFNAVMAGVPCHRYWLLVFRRMLLKADILKNVTDIGAHKVGGPSGPLFRWTSCLSANILCIKTEKNSDCMCYVSSLSRLTARFKEMSWPNTVYNYRKEYLHTHVAIFSSLSEK